MVYHLLLPPLFHVPLLETLFSMEPKLIHENNSHRQNFLAFSLHVAVGGGEGVSVLLLCLCCAAHLCAGC